MMGVIGQEKEVHDSQRTHNPFQYGNEFDGDEIDDDLVFSTVPQRASMLTTSQIHFDEIDDDEMRRFAESLEQEQHGTVMNRNDQDENDIDDDQLCEDYAIKMQTPTKAVQIETKKRKQRCIEDLDALLNNDDNDNDNSDEYKTDRSLDQQQMSPVFKKKI
jgi:hypothetical protein